MGFAWIQDPAEDVAAERPPDAVGHLTVEISVVLSCNFGSLAFLGLLGFLTRQLKI